LGDIPDVTYSSHSDGVYRMLGEFISDLLGMKDICIRKERSWRSVRRLVGVLLTLHPDLIDCKA
jgi:hypothetical protein